MERRQKISQEEERQNISCFLSSVLDSAGFSESIRRFRTEISKEICTQVTRLNPCHLCCLLTGGRAEGAGLPLASDMDVLMICDDVICLSSHQTDTHFTTLKASENSDSFPGYVMVTATNIVGQFGFSKMCKESLLFKDSNGYSFLSSIMFKKNAHCVKEKNKFFTVVGESGPASTISSKNGNRDIDVDIVVAICYYGHNYLSKWSSRNSFRCWPCAEMVEEISTMEGYIVPTGSRETCHTNLEWRVSHVTAENKLIQHFGNSQFKLYVMLKMIAKEFIKPDFPCISSYVIKNVVLWVCELSPLLFFKRELLVEQIAKCFKFIKICVWNNHLPSYFIPNKNLLFCRLRPSSKKTLIVRMDYLIDHGDSIYCHLPIFTKHFRLLTSGPCLKQVYENRDEIEKLLFIAGVWSFKAIEPPYIPQSNRILVENHSVSAAMKMISLLMPDFASDSTFLSGDNQLVQFQLTLISRLEYLLS